MLDNQYVASLDPLMLDEALDSLKMMNKRRDLKMILATTENIFSRIKYIENYTFSEKIAIARDVGMFVSSIKRYGLEPEREIPAITPVVLKLGELTKMHPRNTLMHYSLYNPDGKRCRLYTFLPDEFALMESMKMSFPSVIKSIEILAELVMIDFEDESFNEKINKCTKYFLALNKALMYGRKNISRKVFADEIRCYFDAIWLDGNQYNSTGAAEMPIWLYDHLLWSAETDNQEYIEYKQHFYLFTPPNLKSIYEGFKGVSLVNRILNSEPNHFVLKAAEQVLKMLNMLIGFRTPHLEMAREAYTDYKENPRPKGSGGYSPDILEIVLTFNKEAKTKILNFINTHQ